MVEIRKILGIDPGLRCCGWGVWDAKNGWVDHGTIQPPQKEPLAVRLRTLSQGIQDLCAQYQPDEVALEAIYVSQHPASTTQLLMARGAILAALAPMPVYEYTPCQVKKSLTGLGQAAKNQMVWMIEQVMRPQKPLTSDAADALALAYCHQVSRDRLRLVSG